MEQQESEAGGILPLVINTVASVELFAGLGMVVYSFVGKAPGYFAIGASAVLFSPVLYGLADIVRSLRKIAGERV